MRLDLWSLIEDLPGWRTQRVPSRFLFVAIFAFLVAAATGVQRMLDSVRERRLLHAALRGAVALTAILVFVDLRSQSEPWQEESSEGQQVPLDHRPPIMLIPAAPGSRARFSRVHPESVHCRGSLARDRAPGPGRGALDPEAQLAHRGGNHGARRRKSGGARRPGRARGALPLHAALLRARRGAERADAARGDAPRIRPAFRAGRSRLPHGGAS